MKLIYSQRTPYITTAERLEADLRASLQQRGVAYGETLGSVLEALQALPFPKETPFGSIELGVMQDGSGRMTWEQDEYGALEIREVKK